MNNDTYYINEQGYLDDAGFREPTFDVELARARAATTKASVNMATTIPVTPEAHIPNNNEPEGQLTIDVYQTVDDLVICAPVAGINQASLDIQVSADAVSIRGERRRPETVPDENYLYQECYWGRFSRSVILPQEVDAEGAAAQFANGILTIRLPKLVREKSRTLKVRFS